MDGTRGFVEDEAPNYDKAFYYRMRIVLEQLLASYSNVLNLRIMYPTSSSLNPKNLLVKLVKFERINSAPISISIIDDLWPVLVDMADKKLTGTFNFNNPGVITHNEILELYKSLVEPSHAWQVMPYDERRPAARLDASKLVALGYPIPDVKDSIARLLKKIGHLLKPSVDRPLSEALVPVVSGGTSYKPKNILLTGGAGFIGSNMAVHMVQKYPECTIVVYDILDYCANIKNLDDVKALPNFKFVKGDICDYETVRKTLDEFEIDSVLHFAAQSHVDISFRNSILFTETNVKGTHVMLEASRQSGRVRRFVHVSTDEVISFIYPILKIVVDLSIYRRNHKTDQISKRTYLDKKLIKFCS